MLTEFMFSMVMEYFSVLLPHYIESYIKSLQGHLTKFKLEIN